MICISCGRLPWNVNCRISESSWLLLKWNVMFTWNRNQRGARSTLCARSLGLLCTHTFLMGSRHYTPRTVYHIRVTAHGLWVNYPLSIDVGKWPATLRLNAESQGSNNIKYPSKTQINTLRPRKDGRHFSRRHFQNDFHEWKFMYID